MEYISKKFPERNSHIDKAKWSNPMNGLWELSTENFLFNFLYLCVCVYM